jgi:hypothetical protein
LVWLRLLVRLQFVVRRLGLLRRLVRLLVRH